MKITWIRISYLCFPSRKYWGRSSVILVGAYKSLKVRYRPTHGSLLFSHRDNTIGSLQVSMAVRGPFGSLWIATIQRLECSVKSTVSSHKLIPGLSVMFGISLQSLNCSDEWVIQSFLWGIELWWHEWGKSIRQELSTNCSSMLTNSNHRIIGQVLWITSPFWIPPK